MLAESTLPSWVLDAARLPVAFAQVREDPLIDAHIVGKLAPGSRILMIASGGCTLAYIAALFPNVRIDVVDPNSAQIALSRLRLFLLQKADAPLRRRLLGHAEMPADERRQQLSLALRAMELPDDAIGPREIWAAGGPDFAGRYERVFAALRRELAGWTFEIESVLALRDPVKQARRVAANTELGRALDAAYAQAMALPNLVQLFGEGATQNRAAAFDRHFAHRTRVALASHPAADNPYLWQVLAGRYPPGVAAPWISMRAPLTMPEVHWHCTQMIDFLRTVRAEYDFVHLSNILDWLGPAEAHATLALVHAALRPGGSTLIRQLNSTLDIPANGPAFAWQLEEAQRLHAADRSYFYRALHFGRKD